MGSSLPFPLNHLFHTKRDDVIKQLSLILGKDLLDYQDFCCLFPFPEVFPID